MCPPYVLAAVQAFSLQHGTTQIRFSVPLNVPILADTGCESTAGIIHPEMVALIETHVGHTLPRQANMLLQGISSNPLVLLPTERIQLRVSIKLPDGQPREFVLWFDILDVCNEAIIIGNVYLR